MSATRLPRAVVDTNLFVSALITRRGLPYALLNAWLQELFRLVLSEALYRELAIVLHRPHVAQRYGLTESEITQLLTLAATQALLVEPAASLPLTVRDPKDEQVLAAALGGRADYLITGDADLLTLSGDPRLGALRILTARSFLDLLTAVPEER